MKRKITDWGKLLLLLGDEAIVLLLVILVLPRLGVRLSLPIIIGIVLVVAGLVLVTHKLVISSFHRKPSTGREGMIGLRGKVVKPLKPVGTIIVKGENWTAKSVDNYIQAGENVEVIEVDGLTLRVSAKSDS